MLKIKLSYIGTLIAALLSTSILWVLQFPVTTLFARCIYRTMEGGTREEFLIFDAIISFIILCIFFFTIFVIKKTHAQFVIWFCAISMFLYWGIESDFFWNGLYPWNPAWYEINMSLNDIASAVLIILLHKRIKSNSFFHRLVSDASEVNMGKKINEVEYKKEFGIDPSDKELRENALEHALDIRKFEIDMYWKRAAYFWGLIAAAFAGYFLILASENLDDKKFMAFLVASLGFLFTFAWFQVNRGSKQWQENWENHVDMLEDSITGPLYKTVLSRPDHDPLFERFVTGPSKMSVSKINQIVNLYTLLIWLLLAYITFTPFTLECALGAMQILVAAFTFYFCIIINRFGKTWIGGHVHVARLRATEVKQA